MKQLSIIIVNYNVSYFLEQALSSIFKAVKNLEVEVIVVDNNSVDGSVQMVKQRFPEVTLIANKENLGFSKANNQAIRQAKGKYILLLNPDTVIEEDTLEKCYHFMEKHPEAGALGVKMLDGKGNFLPESKRGLPSPWVAFYKIFGLARLFPTSKRFGRYHLGFLSKDENHEVEILSGAFMWIKKEALDKVGLLDEDYFMYGEDIDLSYRIIKGGYKNYYFSDTRIIHYKGESTKKSSVNYVFVFYKAMIIFAKKHFSQGNAGVFSLLIHFAIYLRAGLSVLARFISAMSLPIADAASMYLGMYLLKNYWENHYKPDPTKFPTEYMTLAVPIYIVVWMIALYSNGAYKKPHKPIKIFFGAIIGSLAISALSNFIDPFRYSKALIILGGVWAGIGSILIRMLIHLLKEKNIRLWEDKSKRIAIVGYSDECQRVTQLLKETRFKFNIAGHISPEQSSSEAPMLLGHIDNINEIIKINHIDEVIFCSKDIEARRIIHWMTMIHSKPVEFKIAPDDSNFIIGSNSKHTRGELYSLNIDLNIVRKEYKVYKRLLDINLSIFFLFAYPFIFWITDKPKGFLLNIIHVLTGKKSWVGFSSKDQFNLPQIKHGIIHPLTNLNLNQEETISSDFDYAKNYSPFRDFQLILKSFKHLGG